MAETVLITGASSGFGEACAHTFARHGCNLILAARRMPELERVRAAIGDSSHVQLHSVDLADAASTASFVDALGEQADTVDVLVNNAGLALGLDAAQTTDFADWSTMVETNILGLLRLTRCLLPGMVERDHGHIINIGSTAGSWPYPGSNVYGATKAFVKNFSQGLRADLVGRNVRVSNIEPAAAATNFSNVRFKGDDAAAAGVYRDMRPLLAEDIAEAVYWVTAVPSHVNINSIEMMSVDQAWGHLQTVRHEPDGA